MLSSSYLKTAPHSSTGAWYNTLLRWDKYKDKQERDNHRWECILQDCDDSPVAMLCMMPMLGRTSATCKLYFEDPALTGIMCCASDRYRRDTCESTSNS